LPHVHLSLCIVLFAISRVPTFMDPRIDLKKVNLYGEEKGTLILWQEN
jgi:hypothetical protein